MSNTFLCKQKLNQTSEIPTIHTLRVQYSGTPSVSSPVGASIAATGTPTAVVAGGGSRLSITILKEEVNATTATATVKNLYNAETAFIKEVLSCVNIHAITVPSGDPNLKDVVAVQVCRQANLIAARTRRGAGNTILVNPADEHTFDNVIVLSTSKIMTHDAVPQGTYIVMYKGQSEIDGCAYFVEGGDENYLFMLPNMKTSLGNWTDYIGVVQVV